MSDSYYPRHASTPATELAVDPEIVWHPDSALSGLRDRAFVGPFELMAYGDGFWAVFDSRKSGDCLVARGYSTSPRERAVEAFLVYHRKANHAGGPAPESMHGAADEFGGSDF